MPSVTSALSTAFSRLGGLRNTPWSGSSRPPQRGVNLVPGYKFVKSSYSGGNAGQECVEVARTIPRIVAVRDSKWLDGPVLVVGPAAWEAFRAGLGQSSG
ncbi:DUF397 domain-containing protein [Streptomyces sp. NPDC092952]|uniref:DUF397 domain-containing protein n=1 Tax=Streptomyces sp. NPDC092952 TaxID=3366018 RepID=UPI003816400B